MSLRLIYGRAGSGKTRFCLNEIKSRITDGSTKPLVLLVPEQFTFQAERDLITVLETGGILKTEVLSFRRLAFRVFNEVGGITYPHIHSAGKCMIIYRILDKMRDSFKVFGKSADRQGFVNTLSTLITELKRYSITPVALENAAKGLEEENPLKDKLNELNAVYAAFEKTLAERYRDSDDDLTIASQKLASATLYDGAEIWIDGFAGFTPQEFKIIGRLMQKAERVNISFCIDCMESEGASGGIDIFSAVKGAYRKLNSIAKENDLKIEPAIYLNDTPLFRFKSSPELSHLEQNLNAYPYKSYVEKTKDISLFSSVNIFMEIEAAARDIVGQCRDLGLRYRDIAVVTRNLAGYEKLIEVIFAEYNIPCFIDKKIDITNHPLVRLILSMLDIFNENWSYESVFRYLKSGLTGVDRSSIDQLENYVLACGIRGSRWTNELDWNMSPDLIPDERELEVQSSLLEKINKIRAEVSGPLLEFRKKTKGRKMVSELCEALYDFLCSIGVPERIEVNIENFRNSGNLILATEYSQVWNIVMEIFDQAVEVMGDETFGIERFSNVLKIGFNEYKAGLIPVSLDQVLVGSVERSKSHEIKALYILGVNDGVFPSSAVEEGILSDQDRAILNNAGIELASDAKTQVFDEQYLVYRALTTAGSYLRISWSIADNEGRTLRPSMIISRLRKLFPAISQTSNILKAESGLDEAGLISGRNSAFKTMVSVLRQRADGKNIPPLWQGVYRWYAAQDEWKQKCLAARTAFQYKNLAQPVSSDKIAALYGEPAYSSVSRLEKYTACPFAFYVQYGLGARDRKVFRLSPPDVGTFMHAVIERFSRLVAQGDIVALELAGLKEMLTHAVEVLRLAIGLEKYQAVYLEDLNNIDSILNLTEYNSLHETSLENSPSWDRLFNALQALEFTTLPHSGKEVDKEKQEYVKKIRDDVKTRIKKLRDKIIQADSNETLKDLKTLYPMMKCLANLVTEFTKRYSEKKSRKSVVDFNDLEHFCLEILSEQGEDLKLRPSKTAFCYRERYAEIMVDEYQDSNMVQEIMISMISKADTDKPNVFMVGDVKQSIYRFRQAKPELFMNKYNTYSMDKGSSCRKILLFKNFRSRKEVVDAVNFIFKQIMSVSVGELSYTDTEALNPGAVFAVNEMETSIIGGEAELLLIQTGGTDHSISSEEDAAELQEDDQGSEEDEEILDNVQCEARLVAKRIHELMLPDENGKNFCVFDKGRKEYRKVEFRDIVILLRTTKNWSDMFMEELSMQGIPVFADTGTGFFKTIEVQVILSLLQIIDNPLQDIPLLSVLRSPIVGFSTDELAELRLADLRASLFDALLKLMECEQGNAFKKAAAFMKNLQRWRDMSLYMSTDQLLWLLYNETGYYGMVGAMPAGEQRQANLRILFERARQFEETSYKGLFNFISFVDKLKGSKGDMGSAKILGENDNVVRIMSIHKSKGLEFPVVILSGCGKKFNLQDMNKSILLHQELGFGPDVVDYKIRLSYPSAPKQAIREKIKTETLSEEMRILYVALTRAREKLIITGVVGDVSKAVAKWSRGAASGHEKLPEYEMLKGIRYLDWIGPALLRHKDCGSLRDYNSQQLIADSQQLDDPSVWRVRVWNKSDILSSKAAEEKEESEFIQWLDSVEASKEDFEFSEEIARWLSWDYAYTKTSKVPAKVSVTELKRRFDAELAGEAGAFPEYLPILVKRPKFLEEKKGLSAAEAGTALHFVMQRLNYHQEDIKAQIDQMVAKDLLTEQQAQSVDVNRISRFLGSPLGKRMIASESVNREVPFNIEIPCHELYKDMRDEACRGETLLLQGVIDCYFEEADGIVLLDYKTDYVPAGKTEMIRERYRVQINYYARALEMLTGKKVKEKYIYLFWNGKVLEF